MAHELLQDVLFTRMVEAGQADAPWALHLLAACEGDAPLAAFLDDGVEPERPEPSAAGGATGGAAPRAYLRSVQVRAFRGIGPQRSLELVPAPGLTIVCGRNGSGKSSFAEALEVLLTGTSVRWEKKTAVWKHGWKNLHETQTPLISAEFFAEGLGSVTLSRKWPRDGTLEQAETVVRGPAATEPLSAYGWDRAASDYRPFLCYSELGGILEDARSPLHDALLAGLGLDQYEAVRKRLAKAQSERKALQHAARERATAMAREIADRRDADPRIDRVMEQLARRTPDLDALEALAVGVGHADPAVAILRALSTLTGPDVSRTTAAATALRDAAASVRRVAQLSSGRKQKLADLLDQALSLTENAETRRCPVCGTDGVLTERWRAETQEMAATLRQDARDADLAGQELRRCVADARSLCVPPPPLLAEADAAGLDVTSLREHWERLAHGGASAEDDHLAAHLDEHGPRVHEALEQVRHMAQQELARREDVWRPVASALAEWLARARPAQRASQAVGLLGKAEEWLKMTIADIRRERLEPIVQQAVHYWSQLRLQSSVDLLGIALTGTANRRSVTLDVRVDGSDASALSVMSQGELNGLALSLFLPRATLRESPFGFVVVDDPVQAMDPAKVEGLARVLSEVAASHQVVVFTHDDRLPEAVRRLGLPARFLEVSRRGGSIVDVRRSEGPVETSLLDAQAVLKTGEVPDALKQRLVPGFCRAALEAACIENIRRRRLGRGERHADVEILLTDAKSLRKLMAQALLDDAEAGGEVERRLRASRVPDAVETFAACVKGAHGEFAGSTEHLIAGTRRLAAFLLGRQP